MDESLKIEAAAEYLLARGVAKPRIGLVLGTGGNGLVESLRSPVSMDLADIPHFPVATNPHQTGMMHSGSLAGVPAIVMQGRYHAYEGYTHGQIVFPLRVMKRLGIEFVFFSNAAGGINPDFKKGDLVLIDDHINLQGGNPLVGPNLDGYGPRFPDMSRPYSPEWGRRLKTAADKLGIPFKEGIYAGVLGPMLETRAEYRYLRIIGADLVGMSTVSEVIAANHMRLPCAAISVVTDECIPEILEPINVPEILEIAAKGDSLLSKILITALEGF